MATTYPPTLRTRGRQDIPDESTRYAFGVVRNGCKSTNLQRGCTHMQGKPFAPHR